MRARGSASASADHRPWVVVESTGSIISCPAPYVCLSAIIFTDTETDVIMDGGAAIFFVSYVVGVGWTLLQASGYEY